MLRVFPLAILFGFSTACNPFYCNIPPDRPWLLEIEMAPDESLIGQPFQLTADDQLILEYESEGQLYRAIWDVVPNDHAKGIGRSRCK